MLALFEGAMENWVNVTNVTETVNGNVTWYLDISLFPSGQNLAEYFEAFVHAMVTSMADIASYLS